MFFLFEGNIKVCLLNLILIYYFNKKLFDLKCQVKNHYFNTIVLNEEAAKQFGSSDPIGIMI